MGFLLVAPSQKFEYKPVAGFVIRKRAIFRVTSGLTLHVKMLRFIREDVDASRSTCCTRFLTLLFQVFFVFFLF